MPLEKAEVIDNTRCVYVSSLLSRFFLGEQSLAKWSLLTTFTWHWHGDVLNDKISRNPLFEVFVYATTAPFDSPRGCPPFLIINETLCEKPLLTSYDFLVLVVYTYSPMLWTMIQQTGRLGIDSKLAVSPISLRIGLLLAREQNVYLTLYINDIFIYYTGYNHNLQCTPCPKDSVLADWPFVRQWIESLCGIVSVGLDSAVAELSSPQVNRVSQQWIESCVLRNWI